MRHMMIVATDPEGEPHSAERAGHSADALTLLRG